MGITKEDDKEAAKNIEAQKKRKRGRDAVIEGPWRVGRLGVSRWQSRDRTRRDAGGRTHGFARYDDHSAPGCQALARRSVGAFSRSAPTLCACFRQRGYYDTFLRG